MLSSFWILISFYLYSDFHIIDIPNPEGERFGLSHFKDALDANSEAPLSELKSTVLKSLYEYTEKELTHDDVTLVALEIC